MSTNSQARFLLTSTSEVYGDPLVHPQPETYFGNVNPIGERSCYDEGKRVAETLTFDYFREHGLEVRFGRWKANLALRPPQLANYQTSKSCDWVGEGPLQFCHLSTILKAQWEGWQTVLIT